MSPELTMQPEDEITLTAPERYHDYETNFGSQKQIAGCSDKKWKLTITPQSKNGNVYIFHYYRDGLSDCKSEELAGSANRGDTVILEGGPGCLPEKGNDGISITFTSTTPEDQFSVRFE